MQYEIGIVKSLNKATFLKRVLLAGFENDPIKTFLLKMSFLNVPCSLEYTSKSRFSLFFSSLIFYSLLNPSELRALF